jgi:hypothetical protein
MKLLFILILFLASCEKQGEIRITVRTMKIWSMPASLHPTNSYPLCKDWFVKDSFYKQLWNIGDPDPGYVDDSLPPVPLYTKAELFYWGQPGHVINDTIENY